MQAFQDNPRFQDNVMYSLAWGEFLRHNITDPLIPFMFMWDGDHKRVNMLQTDGDPEEFAYKLARKSEKKFDQFAIGYEGVIGSEGGEKQDAIIVKAFDLSMPEGVFLAQPFKSKEKHGKFELIGDPILVDSPANPLELDSSIKPSDDYEDVYFSGVTLKKDELVGHMVILSHENPASVASGIKRSIRGYLTGEESSKESGEFRFQIAPTNSNVEFLKYSCLSTIEKELARSTTRDWEIANNRKVLVNVESGDSVWRQDFADSTIEKQANNPSISPKNEEPTTDSTSSVVEPIAVAAPTESSSSNREDNAQMKAEYELMSAMDLKKEVKRLREIPNGRTDVSVLSRMAVLMTVMESRGIDLPGAARANRYENKVQESSGPSTGSIIWGVIIGILILFRLIRLFAN